MARQQAIAVENSFIKGLITEATGLNFPEKACTETYNCIFDNTGKVYRRKGIDYETNRTLTTIDRASKAIAGYTWTNVGGDGSTELIVQQVGATLYFFKSSAATVADPLSDQKLAGTVTISDFVASGGAYDAAVECEFTDGNGFLFVFHPTCDPIYCTYAAGAVTGSRVTIRIRDFMGVVEDVEDNYRPPSLSDQHKYNLQNQGWSSAPAWSASSTTSNASTTGSKTWTVQTGLTGIAGGQVVTISGYGAEAGLVVTETGTVTSYTSGTGALVINVTSTSNSGYTLTSWTFAPASVGNITTWNSALSNYPSNADIWWRFKNSSGTFDPTTMAAKVTLNAGAAPKGYYFLEAFNQNRGTASGLSITTISTTVRPRTGTWFQGRVFYAGIDASQAATGDAVDYSWTENIYFSQIIESVSQFGKCYQNNDPTAEDFFDLLPSDGGVVKIQGCGPVYKLFPIRNGLLVFAENGVWFITGSQGTGFAANDYTIVKMSNIKAISSKSFVNVRGMPYFWNREGIYTVQNDPNSGLSVVSITDNTIASFFASIPYASKLYARGSYDPLSFTIQWVYRSTQESSTTTRYEYDRILVHNLQTAALYPWSFTTTSVPVIHDVRYVQTGSGSSVPESKFRYFTSKSDGLGSYNFTYSEEKNTTYQDWVNPGNDTDYSSYFISGYKIRGDAIRKFQSNWIRFFSENSDPSSFDFQSRWDYAITGNVGRWSSTQRVTMTDATNYSYRTARLKCRGHGLVLQFKISSVSQEPFDLIGWVTMDTANAGV